MNKKIAALGLLIIVLIYLNRSYAYHYDYFQSHFVPIPVFSTHHTITKGNSNNDSIKLVVLGDSLMYGVGSSDAKKSLGYKIGEGYLHFKPTVELANFAIPGAGVFDVLTQELPLALKENPDYVVIFIGINDVHNLKSTSHFTKNYTLLLDRLLEKTHAKIIVVNIPYLGSDKTIIPPWEPLLRLRTNKFNSIIYKLSRERKNIKVIDLYQKFENDFDKSSDLYSLDEFHPSDKGYALWASYINENISQ